MEYATAMQGLIHDKEVLSYQDGEPIGHVNGPAYELKVSFPPVAVLTGVSTASTDEIVVLALRGRPNTRSFGLYMAGQSTANQGFALSA